MIFNSTNKPQDEENFKDVSILKEERLSWIKKKRKIKSFTVTLLIIILLALLCLCIFSFFDDTIKYK
jgi:hypothetical protein